MAITKIGTPELFDFSATNTALQLPTGPTSGTGGRPSNPSTGEWRFNTTLKYVEYYDGAAWFQIDDEAIPSPVPVGENFNVNTYFGNGATQTIDAKFNEAAAFSGQDNGSFINLGSSNIFSPVTQGAITFSCWIKTSNGNSGYIASKVNDKSGGAYEWAIEQLSNGTLTLIAYNNSVPALAVTSSINNTATIDDGNWHNVVAVIVNNTASINGSTTLYIDGVSATSTSWTGTAAESSTAVVFLGAVGRDNVNPPVQPLAAQHYGGLMDQVRFYNSALNQADVTALQLETTTTASSLSFPSGKTAIATYKLDGNSNDIAGNNNGSTPTNTDPIGYTGLKFTPDFVWIKQRSSPVRNHVLFDTVRGPATNLNIVYSDLTNAQDTNVGNTFLSSISTNALNLGSSVYVNGSGEDYVAWNWKAGGAAVAGGAFEFTNVTKSVNSNGGFSIVKFTRPAGAWPVGTTYQHGLSSAPKLSIVKDITDSDNWYVYSEQTGTSNYLVLNDAGAKINFALFPTVDGTSIGYRPASFIGNAKDHISYNFCDVPGVQKIGSYLGNGISKRIYTDSNGDGTGTGGFQVKYVLIKSATSAQSWMIYDSTRGGNKYIEANSDAAEGTAGSNLVTFNSDGFTVANSNSENQSGETFIYLAIA